LIRRDAGIGLFLANALYRFSFALFHRISGYGSLLRSAGSNALSKKHFQE
jgi:hypothetical protein